MNQWWLTGCLNFKAGRPGKTPCMNDSFCVISSNEAGIIMTMSKFCSRMKLANIDNT